MTDYRKYGFVPIFIKKDIAEKFKKQCPDNMKHTEYLAQLLKYGLYVSEIKIKPNAIKKGKIVVVIENDNSQMFEL